MKEQMKTCHVCGRKLMFPYARYRAEGGDIELCSRVCNEEYVKQNEASRGH